VGVGRGSMLSFLQKFGENGNVIGEIIENWCNCLRRKIKIYIEVFIKSPKNLWQNGAKS
jgi:hypothetical protein